MQQANDYYIERGNFRNLLLKFSSTSYRFDNSLCHFIYLVKN